MPEKAYIALGSNQDDPASQIARALSLIGSIRRTHVVKISSLLSTRPVDCPPGSPDFLNAVIEVETDLDARQLFGQLCAIELQMGRRRGIKNGPRVIDLDLILFGLDVINDVDLVVPHPRMHLRRFVLQPLAEIAPDTVHPVLNQTVQDLLDAL